MRSCWLVLVSALLTAVAAVAADNWPQFRGAPEAFAAEPVYGHDSQERRS